MMLGTVSTAARFLSPGAVAGLAAGALLLLAMGGAAGWKVSAWRYGAQISALQVEHAQELQARAEVVAKAQADARARYAADVELGNQAARSLQEYSDALAQQNAELKRRIQHVTSVYRPTATEPARPLPECIFTAGAVRLWNTATGASGAATAGTAADPGGADEASSPADTVDSGVRQPDVLAAITDYGARCQRIERQLIEVLNYTEGLRRGPANP